MKKIVRLHLTQMLLSVEVNSEKTLKIPCAMKIILLKTKKFLKI